MPPSDRGASRRRARGAAADPLPRLPFDDVIVEPPPDPVAARDEASRAAAVDPSRNVVLEASAGTGKTRVLVTRYVNLLRAGVDPANVLAITFTRKAAAEMRERIVRQLRELASQSPADAARWRELQARLGDVGISTIDAFCLSLLREFPLEADLDPGFDVADESEAPRLQDEALDSALRAARGLASADADVELLLARLGERRLKAALDALLGRRLVAGAALRRFLAAGPGPDGRTALDTTVARLAGLLDAGDGVEAFLADGPWAHPSYGLVAADARAIAARAAPSRAVLDRLAGYFITAAGTPRSRPAPAFRKDHCASPAAWTRHSRALASLAPYVADALGAFDRDVNRAMARGLLRLFLVARGRYRAALASRAAVDFTEGLRRALGLLRRMDEFAQSRYRLEARYHHVLVDEFQDTSRAQWRLVARLIESWGEGAGLSHDAPLPPSIFIVGDRKQSIYGFRDADVRLLGLARRHVQGLRPGGRVRHAISRSFRAAPALLAFTNALFSAVEAEGQGPEAFRYRETDRFPVPSAPGAGLADALGLVPARHAADAARAVAAEVERLLAEATVRDRQTGLPRAADPGDVAILFRSRESHREFEAALEARGIPTYVYKGLGFFDADEVKDLLALVRYLADPASDLRAAALLRSRVARLSDVALRRLSPRLAASLLEEGGTRGASLDGADRAAFERVRASLRGWLRLTDRIPPAELLDVVLRDSAYALELRGPRLAQARENLKKVRALTRRLQNRGYATIGRVADHLARLSAGDESNAIIDAAGAVNLMTVHASKGLEFPVVFLVNLGRGTGGGGDPVLVVTDPATREPLVSIGGSLREADEAMRAREREETKRLLYVAVTRARERLYLSGEVREGRLAAGRGSLAEVLPPAIREVFAAVPGPAGTVEWLGPGGEGHAFRLCRPPAGEGDQADSQVGHRARSSGSASAPTGDSPRPEADYAPLSAAPAGRAAAVTAALAGSRGPGGPARAGVEAAGIDPEAEAEAAEADVEEGAREEAGVDRGRLLGTLVHRLFEARAGLPPLDAAGLEAVATRLLGAGERAAAGHDGPALVAEACRCYDSVARSPEIARLFETAECLHEVLFSLAGHPALPGGLLRGSIDCLALRPDGGATVVEIKTGGPRAWHGRQLEIYVEAARALLPGRAVEGLLVYAGSRADKEGAGQQPCKECSP